MTVEAATELLETRSGYAITPTTVAHTSQLPSNMPCEDTWSCGAYTFNGDRTKDWDEWGIFDGHAGSRTAQLLKHFLPSIVGGELWDSKCMDRPYVPNDRHIINSIKKAFIQLDKDIVDEAGKLLLAGGPLAEMVACGAAAFSGSCALFALYDPVRSVLRVANVGDSRAVLGRWDASKAEYVAQAMSIDQTGFNENETARLARDHPDEDVVDPKTGRVNGMAVSRAFGDARWKWPQSLTRLAHDKFWGPSPRPDSMIKTPPYLTAEPEVMETRVQTGDHPDFLIMASDGLWDQMSSEDAVTCVNEWLKKNKPTNFLDQVKKNLSVADLLGRGGPPQPPGMRKLTESPADEDTYYDEDEKCLKWRISPKHFIVEDENCGIHLIKNALGGKRRNLFTGVVSVQPPLSRYVRDDITVHVIFFGQDEQSAVKHV
ncbi:hypothetical protein DOTSEDRAFT_125535 [Dothistroma septosporum NZE10]|uniref:PPM-type phosphatase domain-containing protein n=1 Tax=Dothistroma septosporum (strain NZE10 / CBS 128990) TaxID=675120 RepID=N1PTL4_DOTSN|nr:hypothetical protein DOTSEDRAFT_125535 [Dothistroma septosporum NZE10]